MQIFWKVFKVLFLGAFFSPSSFVLIELIFFSFSSVFLLFQNPVIFSSKGRALYSPQQYFKMTLPFQLEIMLIV